MTKRILMLALVGAGLAALPGQAHSESAVAYTDLSLSFDTATSSPLPGANLKVDLTIFNDGEFAADDAKVTLVIPDGLTFISADALGGSYDDGAGEWTTGKIESYGGKLLTLNLIVDVDGPPAISLVADLFSFTGNLGSYDPDSTPGNMDHCEDDYALLLLTIAGVPDAGVGSPDGGTCTPPPRADAGPGGIDGGTDGDAGLGPSDGDSGGCGCALAGSPAAPWQLLLVGLFLAFFWRRRTA